MSCPLPIDWWATLTPGTEVTLRRAFKETFQRSGAKITSQIRMICRPICVPEPAILTISSMPATAIFYVGSLRLTLLETQREKRTIATMTAIKAKFWMYQ